MAKLVCIGQSLNKPQDKHFACFRVFDGWNAWKLLGSIAMVAALTGTGCQRSHEPLRANAGPPQRVFVGDTVKFAGVASPDLRTSRATYNWDFDWDFSDANIQLDSEEAAPRHVYARPGVYFARLEVTDEQGNQDYDFTTVEVLSDSNSGVQFVYGFEAGIGITNLKQAGSNFTFTLENTNTFHFRLDNCENKEVVIKIYGYGPKRPCPESMTIYPDDYTFDTEGSHADYRLVYNYDYTNPQWQHLQDATYVYNSDEASLEIRCTFSQSPVYLAWSAPYLPSYLYRFWQELEAKPHPNLKVLEIGKTVQGRSIKACFISDTTYSDADKNTVIAFSTQHSFESVHGWTMQGMIKYLLSDAPEVAEALKRTIFKIVPQVNIDGVYLGLYRYNVNGVDLNRDPGATQPEMIAVNSVEKASDNLLFYFKFHTHPPESPPLLEYRGYGAIDPELHKSFVKDYLQPTLGYEVSFKDRFERYRFGRGHFGEVDGFRYLIECSNLYLAPGVPSLPKNLEYVGKCTAKSVLAYSQDFLARKNINTDVCVYGGTASGIMAAVAASREGIRVIVVEPGRWLGGMTGGGISHIDWGNEDAVGGTTLKILKKGDNNSQYRKAFAELLEENGIHVLYEHRVADVNKDGKTIRSITLDYAPPDSLGCPIPRAKRPKAATISAKVFIDCSYEGDLMAMSGVSYTYGRESREQYGESLAGVEPDLVVYDIDPYVIPGDSSSGLLPLIQARKIGPIGSADKLTMGYCLRYKFDMTGKGIPIPEPENYDPGEFEMFRRGFKKGIDLHRARYMKKPGKMSEKKGYFISPSGSGNTNRSLLTTTVWGCNANYPDGNWEVRSEIWKFQQEYFKGIIHFLRTDASVPEKLKALVTRVSFQKGIFDDTRGWPHQLYVREARRMISDYVITQKDVEGQTDPPNSVGLASYGVDEWPYATYAKEGKIALSGGMYSEMVLNKEAEGIYKIPYEAIIPKADECNNLLVPVCLSASHIAMTSLRMEPVWMILGESAGVAAALAVKNQTTVQDVDYTQLRAKLLELDQKLERPVQG